MLKAIAKAIAGIIGAGAAATTTVFAVTVAIDSLREVADELREDSSQPAKTAAA